MELQRNDDMIDNGTSASLYYAFHIYIYFKRQTALGSTKMDNLEGF